MIGRIITLTLLCGLILSCSRYQRPLTEPKLGTADNTITLWTHDLDRSTYRAVEEAAEYLQREVFKDEARCPILSTTPTSEKPRSGINIYDAKEAPGNQFNQCAKPYAAMAQNGRYAIVNLCTTRINPATWTHAFSPNLYLALNLIGRSLGLPPSSSRSSTFVSFTTNDQKVLQPRLPNSDKSPLYFQFTNAEKEALRARYCR